MKNYEMGLFSSETELKCFVKFSVDCVRCVSTKTSLIKPPKSPHPHDLQRTTTPRSLTFEMLNTEKLKLSEHR